MDLTSQATASLTDKVTTSLTDKQLEILGFENNTIWLMNREMLGHKDGEDFETFFHRKHGYSSDKHVFESNKRNLTIEEKFEGLISQIKDIKNPLKEEHKILRSSGVYFSLFPTYYKQFNKWVLGYQQSRYQQSRYYFVDDDITSYFLSNKKDSIPYRFPMPLEFTLFAVLSKDDNNLFLSYMHNLSNQFEWEYLKFNKQLHVTTLNKEGIFTSYDNIRFEPITTFKNTKIPNLELLLGIGSIYDLIIYNHVKSDEEISTIGNKLKIIHNLRVSSLIDKHVLSLEKRIKDIEVRFQKNIKAIDINFKYFKDEIDEINKNLNRKPSQKLLALL